MFANWGKKGKTSCLQWGLFPRCLYKETSRLSHFQWERKGLGTSLVDESFTEPMRKVSCWLTYKKHHFSCISLQETILQNMESLQSVSEVSAQQLPLTADVPYSDWLGDKFSSARGIWLADKHLPLLFQTCSMLVMSQTQGLNKRYLLEPFGNNLCNVAWCSLFKEICEVFNFEVHVGGWSEVLCQKHPLQLGLPMHNISLWLFQPGTVHRMLS